MVRGIVCERVRGVVTDRGSVCAMDRGVVADRGSVCAVVRGVVADRGRLWGSMRNLRGVILFIVLFYKKNTDNAIVDYRDNRRPHVCANMLGVYQNALSQYKGVTTAC